MTTPKPANKAAAPRQQRSRESHERVIAATQRLLVDTRGADFTLPDVSREAGISIGGIYGRFPNRIALILEVQARTNETMAQQYQSDIAQARQECRSGSALMQRLVADTAQSLRQHRQIIKALIDASLTDPQIAEQGLLAYRNHLALFKAALLDYRDAISHPQPEQAIDFCFLTLYEVVASHLGFGRRNSAADPEWEQLVRNLQRQCVAFLTLAASPGTAQ